MPIVFVHGVANRRSDPAYDASWRRLERFLRRYVAPAIADDPDQSPILDAYWGDFGARFAWRGASRPLSPLFGMGFDAEMSTVEQTIMVAELHEAFDDLPLETISEPDPEGLIAAGSDAMTSATSPIRLRDLSPAELSDVAATVLLGGTADEDQRTLLAMAADAVAHDAGAVAELAACPTREAELSHFEVLVGDQVVRIQDEQSELAGMGATDWLPDLRDRLGEVLDRGVNLPGFAASRALAEVRRPVNEQATLFLGDVFTYLRERERGGDPGDIPRVVLSTLAEARRGREGEPLVVLSHSMGGQIVYDIVTWFLPRLRDDAGLRVDFWCATASQVGLFEELKLFMTSDRTYGYDEVGRTQVAFPDPRYLGVWWNVWDHNDFLSYSVHDIIAGVDDSGFNSGLSVASAHSGYLQRPSFFRTFAEKLAAARQVNWRRP